MEISQKLTQLLPHWAEHNEAHAKSYADWAKQAQDAGLTEVARSIGEAVALIEDANGALERAKAALESTT
jgi:hypothetical protein